MVVVKSSFPVGTEPLRRSRSHPHAEHGTLERDLEILPCSSLPGSGCHEVNRKRTALTVRLVRGRVVQGLAVVEPSEGEDAERLTIERLSALDTLNMISNRECWGEECRLSCFGTVPGGR